MASAARRRAKRMRCRGSRTSRTALLLLLVASACADPGPDEGSRFLRLELSVTELARALDLNGG
jgi:hypothetical protein